MTAPTDAYLLLRAFVDELVRCGVTDACTSPGSRSTPLVLSLVRDGRLRCTSHIDERTAGFFALGAAKATRRPVVLACTSGTAAAEYLPAVVEAHEAGVPLIVLTADRPPELREVGAGQAIDQLKLYGSATRWFFEVGTHDASPERLRWMRALACRAVWASRDARPGPVHLNWPLREPLVLGEPLPDGDPVPGRADGRPWLDRPAPAPASSAADLTAILDGPARPVVIAGRSERDPELGGAVARFAEALGAPLLADPPSGARRGAAAVAHYDALLRDEGFAGRLRPDVVVRVGDLPTSKPLRAWLAGLDAVQVAFDPDAVWHDPDSALHAVLPGDPRRTLLEVASGSGRAAPDWLAPWRAADALAARAIDATVRGEPAVARALAGRLPAGCNLVVGSSMPIRDVETFAPVRDDGGPRVLANRGANGIDGTLATAFGAALGAPTALLTGDVAFAYDAGSLVTARRGGPPLAIVCLNNGGGGIFDFLAVSGERDAYEEHVATPPGVDLQALARAYGVRHHVPAGVDDLVPAVEEALAARETALFEVRTDRAENVAEHRRVWAAVAAALASES